MKGIQILHRIDPPLPPHTPINSEGGLCSGFWFTENWADTWEEFKSRLLDGVKRRDEERGINQPMIGIFPVSSVGLAAPRPSDCLPASLAPSFLILRLFTPRLTPLRLRRLILTICGSCLISRRLGLSHDPRLSLPLSWRVPNHALVGALISTGQCRPESLAAVLPLPDVTTANASCRILQIV